ncbi:MAG: hypothetical protein LJF06_16635 [Gemmatimonadetes bacterium]|nr:hypothetical protein [Gemmatimonadota bacterium]
MNRSSTLFALVLLAATPLAGHAQSILSAAGLGFPVDAVDARAQALGGVDIGLQGDAITAGDPAAAAHLIVGTVMMTAVPSWVSYSNSATKETGSFRAAPFPLIGIAYPAFNLGVVTFSFESVLDQRYRGEEAATVSLSDTLLAVTDSFTSAGGVSQIRLGFARAVSRSLSVGLSVGRYGGSLTRRLVRTFNDTIASSALSRFQAGGYWDYSGVAITGGLSADLGTVAHVAGSMTWSSKLKATASSDTKGSSASFDLPVQVRLGATGILAPGLAINAGFTRADWSSIKNQVATGTVSGADITWGAGIELSRASFLGRRAPLRVGYRHSDLPFSLTGSKPVETAWSAGFGLVLKQAQTLTRSALTQASVDLTFENGQRTDGSVKESFKRLALTLRLTGY